MSTNSTTSTGYDGLLETFPRCGLDCFLEAVNNQSSCSVSDLECACTYPSVQATVAMCAAQSCDISDALGTQNLTNSLCGTPSHHDRAYIAIISTFVIISAIFVALRFIARFAKRNPLWWDDYSVLVAMFFAIGFTVLCGVLDRLGASLDSWAVPRENVKSILLLFWVALICGPLSRCFVRVSISLFLMRIFRATGAGPLLILTLVLNVALTITFTICIIFQCTPISLFWNEWDDLHDGFCIDRPALFVTGGCTMTLLDVFLILLPIKWISQLQLSLSKKLTAIGMFSCGVVVTVASIMRVVHAYTFTRSQLATYNIRQLVIWGGLEIDVAIICACLPSLRPLPSLALSWFKHHAKPGAFENKSTWSAPLGQAIHSGAKKRLPSNDDRATGQSRNIWLTTTIHQEHEERPPTESSLNPTTVLADNIELYNRQQGYSWGDTWAKR